MTTNPYAPPTADVADVTSSDELQTPVYFAVSPTKLFVMFFVTFSFYQIYWFYKHWAMIKERERSDVIPVLRAIFSILFAYSMFKNISDEAERYDLRPMPAAGMLAAVWILLNLAGRLPSPGDLLPFASVLLLLPVQTCANRINANIAPDHNPNSHFTVWNWIGIVSGIVAIALAIFGLTLPEE